MIAAYRCKNVARREALLQQSRLNGIDFLEIASPDQKTLAVHFLHNLPGQTIPVPPSPAPPLGAGNVLIEGGVRVKNIQVVAVTATDNVLTVTVNAAGDYSTYTLRLVTSTTESDVPAGFDPQLSAVEFSFKAACPSEFDCKPISVCPPQTFSEPPISYLAKDYETFRRLMLDRMAVTMPQWGERNPADLGVALVETLAYAADYLSYYQDAVATEAYLGTARRRVSVRRHARLLDYRMHDGSNARAWVQFAVELGSGADGLTLAAGTQLLTKLDAPSGALTDVDAAVRAGALVFETLTEVTLRFQHNEMDFYTWGDAQCCLPKGSTHATLDGDFPNLKPQDVLILEEVLDPVSGGPSVDPAHRHPVRLTQVTRPLADPLTGSPITEIAWGAGDALPFPLCVSAGTALQPIPNVSVVRGNVVLADHGRTIPGEQLDPVPEASLYRPQLKYGPVTQQGRVRDDHGRLLPVDPSAPASAALTWDAPDVLPWVKLQGDGESWLPQPDLLQSEPFDPYFVVETEDDGAATLRFGDNVLGRTPSQGSTPVATYRIGNGSAGNVGAEAIAYVVSTQKGFRTVRNPLPASGGLEPESIGEVRLYAPQAFRTQERAVTEADYAEVAERHLDVQRAVATIRWTGSWHTVFVTVDRKGSEIIDEPFKEEVRTFLEQFRLAGYDLEVETPVFVPLDLALGVCTAAGYFQADVEAALLETFSNADLADGRRGFFHPDNFTFGQPVYLSQVVAAAMQVPGVQWVEVDRFQHWGALAQGELQAGQIAMGRLEIARLDNDPNAPENGKIEFTMKGGL